MIALFGHFQLQKPPLSSKKSADVPSNHDLINSSQNTVFQLQIHSRKNRYALQTSKVVDLGPGCFLLRYINACLAYGPAYHLHWNLILYTWYDGGRYAAGCGWRSRYVV
jgi:hypothetical protein